jgi:diguanylate cyclase (GGDEF)-like protein/PAS domain S-box-containing protein
MEEDKYRLLFENAVETIVVVRDKRIIMCNKMAETLSGYSMSEISALPVEIFIHPEDRPFIMSRHQERLEGEAVIEQYEFDLLRKDNTVRRAEVNSIRIMWEGKASILSFISDITERTHAQEALKVSEERYRLLFENSVVSIVVLQGNDIMMCNRKAQEMLGYTAKEIQDMSFLDFIYPEDLRAVIGYHKQRLSGLIDNQKLQFRVIRKNGEIRWVECDGIRFDWNGVTASLNFVIDITESKKSQDALQQSEEKYRLLAEHASDVIWILNIRQMRYTYISPAIFQLRGMYADEAMQESLEESLTPDSFAVIKNSIIRNSGEFLMNPLAFNQYIYEIQQPCKDGKIIWIEASMKYRYSADGEIEIVGVSRNIEERKKNEEEILYLSYFDQLTGLYNRRFYEEELRRLNTGRNLPITIIMADVNGLKLANDAFGHHFGDRLLQTTADIIKSESRSDDIIARIGGDEFVILLPKTSAAAAEIIVNRIKAKITLAVLDGMSVSASFGHATKICEEENMEVIYAHAEDMMYREKLLESNIMKTNTIRLITKNLDEKDSFEKAHSVRVSGICRQIGLAMNLPMHEVSELELLGKMHDIGMIGICDAILNKPSNLTQDEWREMKKHPEIGYQILRSVNEYAQIAEYVLCHHERIDGTGYPRNLKFDQIPFQSRVLSVAEAYDSMTVCSLYREPLSVENAVRELQNNCDTQFDRLIVQIFIMEVVSENIPVTN